MINYVFYNNYYFYNFEFRNEQGTQTKIADF